MSRWIRKNFMEILMGIFVFCYSMLLHKGLNVNHNFLELIATSFSNPFTILLFSVFSVISIIKVMEPLNHEMKFIRYLNVPKITCTILIKQGRVLAIMLFIFYLPIFCFFKVYCEQFFKIFFFEFLIYLGLFYNLSLLVLVIDLFVKRILWSALMVSLLPIVSIFVLSWFNLFIQDYFIYPFMQDSVLLSSIFVFVLAVLSFLMKQLIDFLYYKVNYSLKRGD